MSQTITGILELLKQGGGFLRDPEVSFRPTSEDVWVSNQVIRQYGLIEGAQVCGTTKPGKKKGLQLATVETISG